MTNEKIRVRRGSRGRGRKVLTAVAWIAAIPFVAWAVIRLFGLDGGYPLEAMMPFTPYVAAAAAAAVALALALRAEAPRRSPPSRRSASAPPSCRGSSATTPSARPATGR